MKRISRILAPSDFSACAAGAVEYATDLALQVGATVDVLHLSELAAEQTTWVPAAGEPDDIFRNTTPGRELVALVADLRARSAIPVRGRIQSGEPATTIARVAAEEGYDLIVLGTHGRGALAHLVMGSVTAGVIRHARTPVLVVCSEHR